MQNYDVKLSSEVFDTYRCKRAADSLDIDVEKKSIHHLNVDADIKTKFNVGLILGASGSGKTTLAKKIFGDDCFESILDGELPVIEQFDKNLSYEDCASVLSGIGLTSVPCWIRQAKTLSNGQRARAEAALLMSKSTELKTTVIDEWTSVVDRQVAKAMSFCLQKHARKQNKQIILCSCHYDVIEWLNPDFIIDCNEQKYIDRRSMVGTFKRTDRLRFDIREINSKTWTYFSKYHYLNSNLPGGFNKWFGLFYGDKQIGFGGYSAYLPGKPNFLYSNRVVVHPDFCGLGLGIKFVNETAKTIKEQGFTVRAKFSSVPMYRSRINDPKWKLIKIDKTLLKAKKGIMAERKNYTNRHKVTSFVFEFIA